MFNKTYTLLELNKKIKDSINETFTDAIWIIAEINNINEHRSGHCYLELIQKDSKTDKIIAQSRATIWASRYSYISSNFLRVTERRIEKGISVLARVSVDFHEIFGFSLNIREIDPRHSLGDLEKRKKEIISKLINEGVISMNKALSLPVVIQNIAIISSSGAAGYEDFVSHLQTNKYSYSFNLKLFEADMQGMNTESSVIRAISDIYENETKFDIIAIIRGGGAKSDLSYFDNYEIAYLITQIPIPVISGIGHDRDESVTDMVAHTKLKTPTAVANYLIDHNNIFEAKIEDIYSEIIKTTRNIIKDKESEITSLSLSIYKIKDEIAENIDKCNYLFFQIQNRANIQIKESLNKLNNFQKTLTSYPKVIIDKQHMLLSNTIKDLIKQKNYIIEKKEFELLNLEKQINISNPQNIINRGFSITKIKGKIITKDTEISKGDKIETQVYNKTIQSIVESSEE